MIFWKLFIVFATIGLFGFGGGYGMLSLIQNMVVEKQAWISSSEFTDIVAVSQMTPGPIGINAATYIGYTSVINAGYGEWQAVAGSLLASFAVMLPSFILMLTISIFFMRYRNHPAVQKVLNWMRPVVVGLLAAAVLSLINFDNFGTGTVQISVSVVLFAAAFFATFRLKWNPILVIVLAGVLGGVLYSFVPAAAGI